MKCPKIKKNYANMYQKCMILNTISIRSNLIIFIEASRGAGAQGVTINATSCGFDPH